MTTDQPLTINFVSQSSLQDYETCPLRFKLRYLERLNWPAVESEPVAEAERLARLGVDFHRLVHQHLIGLGTDLLSDSLAQADPDLRRWWANFQAHRPALLAEAEVWPELTLTTPLRGLRLQARFDVLARQPDGRFVIIDWKTAHRKPARALLERRLQSRVYPYVLVGAGVALNGGDPIDPDAVQMLYWYPEFPDEPELFAYSQARYQQDDTLLSDLIERIKSAAAQDDFPRVASDQPCRTCVYRSWCERGQTGGPLPEFETPETAALDLDAWDWDQIAEIQF